MQIIQGYNFLPVQHQRQEEGSRASSLSGSDIPSIILWSLFNKSSQSLKSDCRLNLCRVLLVNTCTRALISTQRDAIGFPGSVAATPKDVMKSRGAPYRRGRWDHQRPHRPDVMRGRPGPDQRGPLESGSWWEDNQDRISGDTWSLGPGAGLWSLLHQMMDFI